MRLANRMRAVSLMVSACQASSCVRIIQPRPSSQSALVLMARLPSLKGRRCGSCCRCAAFVPSQAGRWFQKRPVIVLITIKGTRLVIPVNLSVSDPSSKKRKRSFTRVTQRRFFFFFFFNVIIYVLILFGISCQWFVPWNPLSGNAFQRFRRPVFPRLGTCFGRPADRFPRRCRRDPFTGRKHARVI